MRLVILNIKGVDAYWRLEHKWKVNPAYQSGN